MGTRLNISELREYLIDLYERFLSGENVKEEAKKAFMDYDGADRFISLDMQKALGCLEDIGWSIPQEISHMPKSIRETALERLEALKKEQKNPPKEWFRKVYPKEDKSNSKQLKK
jgi:hypothetical protein